LERIVNKAGRGLSAVREEAVGGRRGIRLKVLRQKKERLGYTVERLTLQSQQRERRLSRMSVAAR
jgi:DASH complex subunit SPC19